MRPSLQTGHAARPRISAADTLARIAGLARGERLTILDAGLEVVAGLLSEDPGLDRGVLMVSRDRHATASAIIDRLLDDFAALALLRSPHWHGCADAVEAGPWQNAATQRAARGLPPRFRRTARELELGRLNNLIDPAGVVLVWEVDPASALRAAPVVESLEWCARHGAPTVAALPATPPEGAPYDRILYGAFALDRVAASAADRFIAPRGVHPASVTERQVADSLEADAELKGLFACNGPVSVGAWGAMVRVDLLCAEHRIVVELDGPEHRAEPKFGNDRHRDYELLTAGYLVLRLTNGQVAADLPLAVEKIRAVVRLRRGASEG